MIWFFTRDREALRIETTHDRAAQTFAVIIHRGDGTQQVESFPNKVAFEQRLQALERQLLADNWTASGSSLLRPQDPASSH